MHDTESYCQYLYHTQIHDTGHCEQYVLEVICVSTQLFWCRVQVPGASRIVSMTLNRKGTRLLVNCYDRAVRLYETCHPGKRRKSYSATDLKTRLAAAKVCKSTSAHTDQHARPLYGCSGQTILAKT